MITKIYSIYEGYQNTSCTIEARCQICGKDTIHNITLPSSLQFIVCRHCRRIIEIDPIDIKKRIDKQLEDKRR